MNIKVTVKQLNESNACSPGLDLFKSIYGNEAEMEWTPETQIEFLKTSPLKKYFGWAVHYKKIPMWSMSGADLSRADLSGVIKNKNTIMPE